MVKCDKTNRRKTLDEFALEAEGNEEEASLSLFDLLCIGIGGTVGSGVFVLTGEVYPVAGPSSALCWMIAGGVCLLSAFSYMELSAAIPTRGSTYAFSLHALGEYWAVAGGVSLMMGYGLSGAGVARSWGEKFALIVGVKELDALGPLPFSIAAGCVQLGSVALIANGVSFSKGVINVLATVMTLLKIALVIFLIAVGFAVARTNPFSSSGDFFAEGASGVVEGTSLLFFGYIGFDEVCCMAARSENPRKSLPRAIAGTLFGAALFSTLAQLALAVSVDDDTNDDDFSFERSFRQKGWSWAKYTAEIGELILLPLVVLLAFMPTPELLAAISLDGLIGPKFAELKGDVYLYGCISSGLALTAVAFLVPFDYIWNTINLGVLMGFNLCNLSLISVRAGNGGTCDNPRAQTLLTSFVVTAAASCYILWKGAFATAMDDSSADRFKEPGGIACLAVGGALMCVVIFLLAQLAREVSTHESRPATVKKTVTKTKSKMSCESYFIDEDAPDLFKAPGRDSASIDPRAIDAMMFRSNTGVPWFTGTAIIINFFLMAQYKWFPDHVAFAALYALAYIGYFFSKKQSGGHADGSTNPSGHSLHPSGMSLKA